MVSPFDEERKAQPSDLILDGETFIRVFQDETEDVTLEANQDNDAVLVQDGDASLTILAYNIEATEEIPFLRKCESKFGKPVTLSFEELLYHGHISNYSTAQRGFCDYILRLEFTSQKGIPNLSGDPKPWEHQ